MADKRKTEKRRGDAQQALECDVHRTLKRVGWLVPENEADVARIGTEPSQAPAPLPETLADAEAVFDGQPSGRTAEVKLIGLSPSRQTEQDLARAAREGGTIPPEIEQVMRRDRQVAEDQVDESDHGEDVRETI